jgi:asparagine synthase (glutamine-hydrolysing)
MFLSGGTDSSAIVALASRLNSRPVKTFTIVFGESSYDERPFARTVATHCGTDHEAVVFSAREAAVLLHDVGRLLDEPLVDSSFLPLYLLSRSVRRAVTVVLSGDGGDELFCDYPTFLADRGVRWLRRLPHWASASRVLGVRPLRGSRQDRGRGTRP